MRTLKIFKGKIEKFKTKRDLNEELKFYKEFIFKKLEHEELNSSLNKTRSAIILIKEHQAPWNTIRERLKQQPEGQSRSGNSVSSEE